MSKNILTPYNSTITNHLLGIFRDVRNMGSQEKVNAELNKKIEAQIPSLLGRAILAEASLELYPKRRRPKESSIYSQIAAWADEALYAEDIEQVVLKHRRFDGNAWRVQEYHGNPVILYAGSVTGAVIVHDELRLKLENPDTSRLSFSGTKDSAVARIITPNYDEDGADLLVHTQLHVHKIGK